MLVDVCVDVGWILVSEACAQPQCFVAAGLVAYT